MRSSCSWVGAPPPGMVVFSGNKVQGLGSWLGLQGSFLPRVAALPQLASSNLILVLILQQLPHHQHSRGPHKDLHTGSWLAMLASIGLVLTPFP